MSIASRNTRRLPLLATALLGALPAAALLSPATADASPALTATSTTTTTAASGTTPLAGLAISDGDSSADVQVTVSTTIGDVSFSDHDDVTLAYGNAWSDQSVSFDGTPDHVNAVLASAMLSTGASDSGDAKVSISAVPYESGMVFSASNGHFYQYVASPGITWTAAQTAAGAMSYLGQSGYLASIPSKAVNDLVSSKIEGATDVWIGAESTDTSTATPARAWTWSAGPLAGSTISSCGNWTGSCDFTPASAAFQSWAVGEPNNAGATTGSAPHSGEWAAVTNWDGTSGKWNDLAATNSRAGGYLVEYGNQADGSTGFAGVSDASSTVQVEGQITGTQDPVMTGSSALGGTLAASLAGLNVDDAALSYQWLADGKVIRGATASSFRVTRAQVHQRISVRVTAAKTGFAPVTLTSGGSHPAATFWGTAAPSVVGKAVVGRTVKASFDQSGWAPTPTSFGFQWYAGHTKIKGATNAGFRIPARLRGQRISVVVIAHKAGYVGNFTRHSSAVTVK